MIRRTRQFRILLAAGLAIAVAPVALTSSHADTDPSTSTTVTRTITRTHLDAGTSRTVDTRTVGLTVSQTQDLRSQRVTVSWTGAHPTGGIVADPTSSSAAAQEYPMVLLECRGTGEDTSDPALQLSPQTCWTQTQEEREVRESGRGTPTFPAWRLDSQAAPADRVQAVNPPANCPAGAFDASQGGSDHIVPFVAADGTVYPEGPFLCSGQQPSEQTGGSVSGNAQPGNTQYAVTGTDGTGHALFSVWTSQDNASLGCSDTVPCSLVAVPILGIGCDVGDAQITDPSQRPLPDSTRRPAPETTVSQANAACEATGTFAPGLPAQDAPAGAVDQLAVSGSLWWSPSNWNNRIVVPLSFAPSSSVCDVVTDKPELDVYGSELMGQAAAQWAPSLCQGDGRYVFRHVEAPEPEARNLVGGGVEAAFVTDAPEEGYGQPTVSAPTAVTGFSVSYTIDSWNGETDSFGQPYHALRLTPRLLAKLLTESYSLASYVPDREPVLAHNPINITADPEFQALNSGFPELTSEAAASLVTLSGGSDVITALTSYIWADPEARAWLNGAPDPWGMTVNPAYDTNPADWPAPLTPLLTMPTDTWPLLDQYLPDRLYAAQPCGTGTPVPYAQLVASPQDSLATITQDVELGQSTVMTACNSGTQSDPALQQRVTSRPVVGQRFVIGITPLADADRDLLDSAALETQASTAAPAKFTDASGRSFVAPSAASLDAAARFLTPDTDTGTWDLPYDTLRTDPAGAAAYPGTMLVSTAVPTQGLEPADAANYANFLRFVAGAGQTPGFSNGELPPGYLPLTIENGLSPLADYTYAAADAVEAQTGDVPPLTPVPDASATPTPTPDIPSPSVGTGSAVTPATPVVGPSRSAGPAPTLAAAPVAPQEVSAPEAPAATTAAPAPEEVEPTLASAPGRTVGHTMGWAAVVLPLLLLLTVGGGGGASFVLLLNRRRAP